MSWERGYLDNTVETLRDTEELRLLAEEPVNNLITEGNIKISWIN